MERRDNWSKEAPEDPQPKKQTLAKALGLAATGKLPPDDEEVQRILDQARLEKYL